MLVYALAAMKVVYGGGWFGTVGRALLIAFAYLLFFGLRRCRCTGCGGWRCAAGAQ